MDVENNIFLPNTGLGLTRDAHAVMGYEQLLAEDIQLKAEAYYQYLYDLSVENDPTSSYTSNNFVACFTNTPLVNEGAGYDRGVEFSVEKFFTCSYHYGNGFVERVEVQSVGPRMVQLPVQHPDGRERTGG